MAARVLFFGATADSAGTRQTEIETGENSTAASVLELLLRDYPSLAAHRLKVSINRSYAADSDPVRDGDELAVFTAVSGG